MPNCPEHGAGVPGFIGCLDMAFHSPFVWEGGFCRPPVWGLLHGHEDPECSLPILGGIDPRSVLPGNVRSEHVLIPVGGIWIHFGHLGSPPVLPQEFYLTESEADGILGPSQGCEALR